MGKYVCRYCDSQIHEGCGHCQSCGEAAPCGNLVPRFKEAVTGRILTNALAAQRTACVAQLRRLALKTGIATPVLAGSTPSKQDAKFGLFPPRFFTCGNCDHWMRLGADTCGSCRAPAPMINRLSLAAVSGATMTTAAFVIAAIL